MVDCNRKVIAANLIGGMSLEPLRTRLPAGDHALGAEHVVRVIGDALDQQLKAARANLLFVYRSHIAPAYADDGEDMN